MARHFDDWLNAYLEFTDYTEAPQVFHIWTGIWTVAGALRRQVWIDMLRFQWVPNFYIVLVGPAGMVTKSTTTGQGAELLRHVPGVRFGPQSATWQALTKALEEAQEYVRVSPEDRPEDMVQMSAVSMNINELGTFLKMSDKDLGAMLISLWEGQLTEWGHRTVSAGETLIKNPWLNIIGATTPTWLKENFDKNSIGGGLASRVVFVYGEAKRNYIAWPDEVPNTDEFFIMKQRLIEDLVEIGKMVGPYQVHPDARDWYRPRYKEFWENRPRHLAADSYSPYASRKQTHMMKVAMVLAACRRDERIITVEDLIKAEGLLSIVEPHMIHVFESVEMNQESEQIQRLVTYVRNYKWLPLEELRKCTYNIMSTRELSEAVSRGIDRDIFGTEERNGVKGLVLKRRLAS